MIMGRLAHVREPGPDLIRAGHRSADKVAIVHTRSITTESPCRRHWPPAVGAADAAPPVVRVAAAARTADRLTPGMLRWTADVSAERTTLSAGTDPSEADSSRTALRRTRTMRRAFSMSACPG